MTALLDAVVVGPEPTKLPHLVPACGYAPHIPHTSFAQGTSATEGDYIYSLAFPKQLL